MMVADNKTQRHAHTSIAKLPKVWMELVASPAAIDVVGSVDDDGHVLLVQLHAGRVVEEVLMHGGSGAPGHKLIHTARAVPIVGQ